MKAKKDSARPEHAAAKDILSRLIEARGWTVEQEMEFPWDFSKRTLRVDVVAKPPRRAKGPKMVGFELQSLNVGGKKEEVQAALRGGVVGFQDVHVIDISDLKFTQPQQAWHDYLMDWVELLEEFQ